MMTKEAKSEYRKKWYQANRDWRLSKNNLYYIQNRDRLLEKTREYKKNNRGLITKYLRDRKEKDVQFRLACNLRSRLAMAIKKDLKTGSAVRDLGCSIPELKKYLENKFTVGMSWDKRGEIHIDHIIPLSSFDLTNREHFLKANHFTNLQPLWSVDNIRKSNKLSV